MTEKTNKKPHCFEVTFYEHGKHLVELDERYWFNFEEGEPRWAYLEGLDGYSIAEDDAIRAIMRVCASNENITARVRVKWWAEQNPLTEEE